MEDEDIQVTSDDGEEEGGAENVAVSGLPPYVDAIIQGYGQQFGRVVSRKVTKRKGNDPNDRDRLVVTYENGERKRTTVTFRIGNPGTPPDPQDSEDTGTPAETTTVESVDEVKAPTPRAASAPPTKTVRGPDGKNHIMERNPTTGEYDVDRGLASDQPAVKEEKPKPSAAANWQPLKGPDGRVIALLDPSTGDTVAVTQKDPKDPTVFQTKDGRVITVSPDGSTAKDVTPEGPGDKMVPSNAPKYRPDYTKPDGGLTDYNEALQEARRAGIINREQGLRLLQQAGALWETTATHGAKLADQQRSIYDDQISQRGQSLGEVQSRRSNATSQFSTVNSAVSSAAEKLLPGPNASGQTVVDAYRALLGTARAHNAASGGDREVPEVPLPPGLQQVRNVRLAPDGSIEIQAPTGPGAAAAPAAPAAAPTPANTDALPGSGARVGANDKEDRVPTTPVNPPAGEPGNDPSQPVGMGGGQDQLGVLTAMGFDPQEAQNVLALYRRGVRHDQV